MFYIYILELTGGNYYIGFTDNLEKRIAEHKGKNGASWTKIYEYISTIETISLDDCDLKEAKHIETEYTLKYMSKYGWKRVRGGKYSSTSAKAVFSKLKVLQEKGKLCFEIAEPLEEDEIYLEFYGGINRSQHKLSLFKDFDSESRKQIYSSIHGSLASLSKHMTVDELRIIDCSSLTKNWIKKKKPKYPQITFDEVFLQFNKLILEKINRTGHTKD